MNNNSLLTVKIGAIVLFVYSALRIILIISDYTSVSLGSWIYYSGIVAIGAGSLMKKYRVSTISSAVCALLEVIWLLMNIHNEDIWQVIVYDFSYIVAFVLLIVFMLPYITNSVSRDVHKLWFLPGAIHAVGYIPYLLHNISFYYNYLTDSFKYVFVNLLFIAGVFLIGHGICNSPATLSGSIGLNTQQSLGKTSISSSIPTTSESPIAFDAKESFSSNNFKMLRKYKELLDAGIITQEEFDEKKKVLLGY